MTMYKITPEPAEALWPSSFVHCFIVVFLHVLHFPLSIFLVLDSIVVFLIAQCLCGIFVGLLFLAFSFCFILLI